MALIVIASMLVHKVVAQDEDDDEGEETAKAESQDEESNEEAEESEQTTVRVEGLEDEDQDEAELPEVGDEDSLPGAVVFDSDSEEAQMENFKRISEDLKVYEEEYKKCIDDIPDDNYTDEQIDECVGKNFIKVVLDIKYETLKVMSRADTKIRQFFITACYTPAGTIEEFSVGCDYMERDTLDFMWNGLDFIELLEINKKKYTDEYGKIPREDFLQTMELLTGFAKVFFELLDEIDSHKEITIIKLKTHIDDRSKIIIEEAKLHPELPQPSTVSHSITIEEKLKSNESVETSQEINNRRARQVKQQPEKPAVSTRKVRQTNSISEARNNINKRVADYQYKVGGQNPYASRLASLAKGVGLGRKAAFPQRLRPINPYMRAQGKVAFKNIHTREFSKRSSV